MVLAGGARDCAHRHGSIDHVFHFGLDSHHWLLVTQPPFGAKVGSWHLLVQRSTVPRLVVTVSFV